MKQDQSNPGSSPISGPATVKLGTDKPAEDPKQESLPIPPPRSQEEETAERNVKTRKFQR